MSIEDIGFDNTKFGEVWDRVINDGGNEAHKPSPGYDEASQLRTFMNLECEAARGVAAISERCCSHIRAALAAVADCDRRHFKALRARYFILTGERYCPPDSCPVIGTVTEALRNIYITKLKVIAGYDEAADAAKDSVVSEMYEQLMEEEECTAEEIYGVIIKLMR